MAGLKPHPFTNRLCLNTLEAPNESARIERKNKMPRRNDITKILVIGSGPIVIGQSAEFDYSGTQACKALKAEGYEVVLVNSNPASIMTDPEVADRTYIEPLTPAYLEEILRVESEMMGGASTGAGAKYRGPSPTAQDDGANGNGDGVGEVAV